MNIILSTKSLIYVTLICSLITLLFSSNRLIKSIKYICGLITLIALLGVLSPVIRSLGALADADLTFDPEEGESGLNGMITEQSASYICEYVKTLIEQKFSVSKDNVSVSVTLDTEDMQNVVIKNVTLSFINTEKELYIKIAEYISDAIGCECTVISK